MIYVGNRSREAEKGEPPSQYLNPISTLVFVNLQLNENIKMISQTRTLFSGYSKICFLLVILFVFAGKGFSQFKYTPDTSTYKWLLPEFDTVQFYQREAMLPFYQAWKSSSKEKMVVVYMGDSHVQSDILPGELRRNLQSIHGAGGRGMVFPYSTAKTYSSVEYKSTHTGNWLFGKGCIVPSRIPLGVTGMTARTSDSSASFTITFLVPVPDNYDKLRVYCKHEISSFDFILTCGTKSRTIHIDSSFKNNEPFIELDIPPIKDPITIKMHKSKSTQSEFEFYGMDIESSTDKGAVVHAVGVGAAQYQSVLYENLVSTQLLYLNPDLVVLDFGTNDYLYDDSIKSNLQSQIIQIIKIVRTAAPKASILLTSTMDMYRRGHDLHSGIKFSDLIRNIAKKDTCLFFDWFWIAGGQGVMKQWQQSGLAQKDMIHLTFKGYDLKGDLLTNALAKSVEWMDKNPKGDSLVLNTDSIRKKQLRTLNKEKENNVKNVPTATGIQHVILKGETLGSIARKYGVTIALIKKWNGLTSDMIIAGKILWIY